IKQKLERSVGLAAKCDFRTKHEELAFSDLSVHNGDRVFQVALAPAPTAAQRLVGVKPGDGLHAFGLRIRLQLERRIVLKKEVDFVAHAERERIRVVNSRLQN